MPSHPKKDAPPPISTSAPKSHTEADAARAMQHTNSWTPTFTRRQSWNKEDQKHEMHMTGVVGECKPGLGFSER